MFKVKRFLLLLNASSDVTLIYLSLEVSDTCQQAVRIVLDTLISVLPEIANILLLLILVNPF